jgi:hypothetical protein
MKSVAVVAVLGFVLAFSSCKKDDDPKPKEEPKKEHDIVGKWKYDKVELKEFECSDPLMTIMLKTVIQQYMSMGMAEMMTGEIEFTKDGKAITRMAEESDDVATYTVNGSKLTTTSEDGFSTTYDISFPNKNTMCWDMNADADALEELSEGLQMLVEEVFGLEGEVQVTKCKIQMTLTRKQ